MKLIYLPQRQEFCPLLDKRKASEKYISTGSKIGNTLETMQLQFIPGQTKTFFCYQFVKPRNTYLNMYFDCVLPIKVVSVCQIALCSTVLALDMVVDAV